MQVSSLLSRKEIQEHHHDHDHDHDHDCGHDHEHTNFRLTTMVAGVVFIANSFFMEWFAGTDNQVAGISAFVGAMILGFPILGQSEDWETEDHGTDKGADTGDLVVRASEPLHEEGVGDEHHTGDHGGQPEVRVLVVVTAIMIMVVVMIVMVFLDFLAV